MSKFEDKFVKGVEDSLGKAMPYIAFSIFGLSIFAVVVMWIEFLMRSV